MAEDRIDKLAERFRTHATGRKPARTRKRTPTSLYLDGEVVSRLDKAYRDRSHALHPVVVSKSVFLETLMEQGLAHLDELKPLLKAAAEGDSAA
jgi:Ser/Thr protein kinase RdoA (MazF antagonist)